MIKLNDLLSSHRQHECEDSTLPHPSFKYSSLNYPSLKYFSFHTTAFVCTWNFHTKPKPRNRQRKKAFLKKKIFFNLIVNVYVFGECLWKEILWMFMKRNIMNVYEILWWIFLVGNITVNVYLYGEWKGEQYGEWMFNLRWWAYGEGVPLSFAVNSLIILPSH